MAFSALRDANRIPIWWGLSSVDGVTPTPIQVDSATGKPKMEIGTSVSAVIAHLKTNLSRDDNHIPCVGGQSNADSTIIIPVSVNPTTGAILAQTV
jgi:hypothetical protein